MNKSILEFLKSGAEPFPDQAYGDGYRCSAYLKDGTFLPCVMLRKSGPTIQLALRRFEEEKKGQGIFRTKNRYKEIVKTFLTSGNRINDYDISRVEKSRYAIPREILNQIEGETTMSWTGFVLEMRSGQYVSFGTSFLFEFFDLPAEYTFDDVIRVHNHSYVSKSGELKGLREGYTETPERYDIGSVCREKPYFVCYTDV